MDLIELPVRIMGNAERGECRWRVTNRGFAVNSELAVDQARNAGAHIIGLGLDR